MGPLKNEESETALKMIFRYIFHSSPTFLLLSPPFIPSANHDLAGK
jgi:hypothetical protein